MNGETVCSNHPVCVFSSRSITSAHDEKTMKLTQEERCSPIGCQQTDAERQGEGRRTNPKDFESDFLEMESSYSQRSACWADQPPSPRQQQQQQQQQLHPPNHPHRAPSCLRNPSEHTLTLSHSLSPSPTPLHANNQRGGVRFKVKGKKSALRLAGGKNSQNRKVTDYFPIRRSSRKSKTELKDEEKKQIDELITKGIEEGMEVQYIEGKGRGVFASRSFYKGEYVVEYHGDLLEIHDAKQREAEYALNPATGCYMYYFQFLCKTYCVDATKESGRMGRLINHSKNGNCQTKLHDINSVPHLILVASRDIDEGEELLYDYGDRSKDAIAAHPWLKY